MSDIVSDELELALRKPIKLADREISSITLREPTAFEIEQVSKKAETNGAAANTLLVALVSGLTPGEIGKMGISDLNKALAFLKGFINAGQETGKP